MATALKSLETLMQQRSRRNQDVAPKMRTQRPMMRQTQMPAIPVSLSQGVSLAEKIGIAAGAGVEKAMAAYAKNKKQKLAMEQAAAAERQAVLQRHMGASASPGMSAPATEWQGLASPTRLPPQMSQFLVPQGASVQPGPMQLQAPQGAPFAPVQQMPAPLPPGMAPAQPPFWMPGQPGPGGI